MEIRDFIRLNTVKTPNFKIYTIYFLVAIVNKNYPISVTIGEHNHFYPEGEIRTIHLLSSTRLE